MKDCDITNCFLDGMSTHHWGNNFTYVNTGDSMQLYPFNFFCFCCVIYGTIVQIQRTRKDLLKVYLLCKSKLCSTFTMKKLFWRIQELNK